MGQRVWKRQPLGGLIGEGGSPLRMMRLRECCTSGSGMGTAGLVGPLMAYQTMVQTQSPAWVLVQIALMHFILPAALTLGFSELFRRLGWIRSGDMKLDL